MTAVAGIGRGSPEGDQSERRLTRSTSQLQNGQSSLNAWLQSSNAPSGTAEAGTANRNGNNRQRIIPETVNRDEFESSSESENNQDIQSEVATDVPLSDLNLRSSSRGESSELKLLLMEIGSEVRHTNKKFDRLEKSMNSIKKDDKKLKEQNKLLTATVNELSNTLEQVDKKVDEIEKKNERLEAQSRRENVKFYNIPESVKEDWDETERKVRDYIAEELRLDESTITIERAHRIGSKAVPRPIIVKFSFYTDKAKVLKTYREKQKELRKRKEGKRNGAYGSNGATEDVGSEDEQKTNAEKGMENVRVSEDFVARVTRDRSKMYPYLQDCLKEGKDAFLRYDQLVVDGVAFVYDYDKNNLLPIANREQAEAQS